MPDIDAILHGLITRQTLLGAQAVETAVESMLVDPESRGIMVVEEADWAAGSITETYILSPEVPFGHIFRFPSAEAVRAWRECGRPM